MADHSVFAFEPAFLARLERLRLLTRRVPAGGFKGEHRASHLGAGLEFADYRPYVEGDDVRHLDWRAYLRFDRLLLRQFEEHGDLAVYILLDCSHSMAPTPGSGGRRKFDAARRIAAALAYIALATLDRVTLAPYSGHVHQVLGPLHGSRQVWRAWTTWPTSRPAARPASTERCARSSPPAAAAAWSSSSRTCCPTRRRAASICSCRSATTWPSSR